MLDKLREIAIRFQTFLKLKKNKNGDSYSFNKHNVKEVFLVEEMEYDTYPFKPNMIQFEGTVYVLNEKLNSVVEYEDDCYTIKNELLDIFVFGDTREEVEIAFAFNFHAIYENFVLEHDEKLSSESKELKNKLLKLIKTVLHEAKKD